MPYEFLIFTLENHIATIAFNRPKALNALNSALLEEFNHALKHISDDESIRVLILTGSGEKAFVAGADIAELATLTPLGAKTFSQKGHEILARIQSLPIPVLAAVNGFALGGGSEIALACDFIYASENAKFGFPEINLGLIPGFGGTQRTPRLVGMNKAKELIFSGELVTAEEAYRIGMVNKICHPEQLMEEAVKTSRVMASKGKVSLRAAKQAINYGMSVDLDTGCHLETDGFALCFSSPDAREGTKAFLEKRNPVFKADVNG
jgi:enoyl-CoA hydratase